MQGEYDKSRWFELVKSAPVEQVSAQILSLPKAFLLGMTDNSPSRHTCLFYAVQQTNLQRGDPLVELLLHQGADANYRDTLQQTPLFYASRFGHNRQVEMLINAGAEPNQKDNYGQTALYYCARQGQTQSVALLTNLGAQVNLIDNLGQTPIFYACREGKLESTRILAEKGALINQSDKTRNTPLSWAKKSGNMQLVEYLIEKGAQDRSSKKKKESEGRKRESKKKNQKRIKCQLMISDDSGEKRVATHEEIKEFQQNFPEIAKYWLDPESLQELESMDQQAIDNYKPWEKPGKKLLNILWRNHNSWIFHQPVDPEKLGILDYFDYVKNPMDFGTIKKKLNNNVYPSGEDLIRDFELVFYNCRLYNQPESDVYNMCNIVQGVYETQLKTLGLDKYKHPAIVDN